MNRALNILDWAFSQPGKDAIVTDEAHYTWGELRDAVLGAAAALQTRIHRGTRVALYIDSTPNFVVYQYATFYLGGVVTPINRMLKEAEVREVLEELGHELVISDAPLEVAIPVVVVRGEFDSPGAPDAAPPPESMSLDDPALILQTSGSTGRPKGVVLTHGNLVANYDPTHRWIGVGKDDRLLLTLPIFNTYALNQGVNLLAMSGATMRLVRRFSVETVQRALDDTRPTFIPLVPTMLTRLFQAGVVYDEPVVLGLGAASSPGQVVPQAWTVFPRAFLFFGYGLTEGTAIASQNRVGTVDAHNGDWASVGVPVPGVSVRLDPTGDDDGRGEILLRGDAVFTAYVGGQDRPVEDGWLRTGDVGRFAEGRLHIVDRKRDLIIRGGQNVYPGELEHLISSHAAVLEAAVVAAPDDDLGEVPVAFAVLRDGADATPEELLAWLRPQVAGFKMPVALHPIDSMPKTPTGKIRKLDLREALAEGLLRIPGGTA
jgi:long-chain acyl-CoA synthetase